MRAVPIDGNYVDELPSWTSAYGIGIGLERRVGGGIYICAPPLEPVAHYTRLDNYEHFNKQAQEPCARTWLELGIMNCFRTART